MKRTKRIMIAAFCGLLALSGTAFGAVTLYDFSIDAGADRFAFGTGVSELLIPPTVNTIPSIAFTGADYAAVEASEDSRYSTGIIEGGNVAATRFVFTIAELPPTITQMDVLWEGGASEDGSQTVWLWNAITASYVQVGSQAVRVPPDGTVAGTFTTDAFEFVEVDNTVTILVTGNAGGNDLLADYVNVAITTTACGVDADCDDGLFCNGSETCVGGTCQLGTSVDCDDGKVCTFDSCNEATDSCDNVEIDYAIVAIPTLGGPSNYAYGLNDLGHVVGYSSLNFEPGGDSHGYLWDAGTLTDLGTLGGSNSVGFDVNNAVQVTGYAEIVTGVQHAFLWQNGVMTDLMAAYPGTFGSGWGINEFAQVAGHYGAAAFFWENGVLTNLGSLCGSPVRAYGINEAGQVAGHSSVCAIFWEDDGDPGTNDLRNLGTLPGGQPRARARGINDVGQVVGEANFGSPDLEDYHAVLWENLSWDAGGNYTGDITDLGYFPGGQRSFAYAVNNSGRVVGYASSVGIGVSRAFVYDAVNGMRDLNDLIPTGSGWTLGFAMDINESGQIVGSGTLNGQGRGYLLTPVPKPGTGDLDCDDDVDTDDFLTFSACFNGALNPPQPSCANANADLDGDGDVDVEDFLTFSTCFNGSLNPPGCP